jgi:hypothetical protein
MAFNKIVTHNKANSQGQQKAALVPRNFFAAGDLQHWALIRVLL